VEGKTFDELIKRLTAARLSRLDALRGVLASAAVGLAGATLATEETAAKKGGKGKGRKGKGRKGKGKGKGKAERQPKVTLCHKPGTPDEATISVAQPAVDAHLGHGDTRGPCPAPTTTSTTTTTTTTSTTTTTAPPTTTTPPPVVCSDAVLAGAAGPADDFLVDDDLVVFVDGTSVATENLFTDPIPLGPLTNGADLRVVASNTTNPTFCNQGFEHLDAITLYCPSRGTSQVINPTTIAGQPAGGCGHVFFDETITVAL
jgi:hypothetical protein